MLFRFSLILPVFLYSLSLHAASGLKDVELKDLYFGEILFYAYQDKHFDALSHLDIELSQYYELDESELDVFRMHVGQAEFSIGDIELQYRMSQRAGKAIQAVLDENIDLATRNVAALKLARMFYKKDDPQSTLYALNLIREEPDKTRYQEKYSLDVLRGKEPETFKIDVAYLRALAYIEIGQFSQAAEILQNLRGEKTLKGFVLYNLGIALVQSGKEEEGLQVWSELGQIETDDKGLLALRDKINLKLAYRYLDTGNTGQAKKYFQRVRLDGPFSNKALLGAGWVAVAENRFDRALVAWSILHERAETNVSVQESLMAVPYAYGKLGAYGRSANLYKHAMDVFAAEIERMDDSIKSIRKGKFLQVLLDERADKDKNWVVNLRSLPDAPETRYTLELMASNDFQESYKNYKDLAELRQHIDKWLNDLRVFEEMIEIRRAYQEPLLPVVEEKFKKVDARMKLRLEQRDNLAGKLKNMLIAPRPEYLATSAERQALDTIMALEAIRATTPGQLSPDLVRRMQRLRGVVQWNVKSEYDQRLTDAYNNLIALDKIIHKMKVTYNSFIRTRQAATQSYEGYTIPLRQARTRLFSAQRELKGVMAKQGRIIETMAINELDRRRKRLEEYQIKARFALAESYDRATKAQLDAEIEKQRKKQQGIGEDQPAAPEGGKQEAMPAEETPVEDKSSADKPEEDTSSAAPANDDEPAKKSSAFKDKLRAR
jgi:predicted negative regulator of RcsB-dependent stress response